MIEYKKLAVICSILLALVAFGGVFVKVIKWSRGTERDVKYLKNYIKTVENSNDDKTNKIDSEIEKLKNKIDAITKCETDLKVKDGKFEVRLKNLEKHH